MQTGQSQCHTDRLTSVTLLNFISAKLLHFFWLHPAQCGWSQAGLLDWFIDGKYRIMRQIGVGSFGTSISFTIESTGAHCHTGEIYAGYNICSGKEVTIKLKAHANSYLHLENEYKLYQILGHHIGILHLKWFGIVEGHTVMALNLLGLSLEELFISNNHTWKGLNYCRSNGTSDSINFQQLHSLTPL